MIICIRGARRADQRQRAIVGAGWQRPHVIEERHAAAREAEVDLCADGVDDVGALAEIPQGKIKVTQEIVARLPAMQSQETWLAELACVELLANELTRRQIAVGIDEGDVRVLQQ